MRLTNAELTAAASAADLWPAGTDRNAWAILAADHTFLINSFDAYTSVKAGEAQG